MKITISYTLLEKYIQANSVVGDLEENAFALKQLGILLRQLNFLLD